jgi:hypothetical protein
MSHLLITHQGISDFRPLDYSEGKRCEGENSLKPEARILLNYGAKVYLALAPELHDGYKRSVPLPIPVTSLFRSRSFPKTWVSAQNGNDRRPTLIKDTQAPSLGLPWKGAYAIDSFLAPFPHA